MKCASTLCYILCSSIPTPVVIGLDPTVYTVDEGGTVAVIARVLDGEVTLPVEVTLSTDDGTAISECTHLCLV